MKMIRLITLLAAAAAFLAQAESNVVSSANVVGYVQKEIPSAGNFDIFSVTQFSDGSNTVHIQDAIDNIGDLNASATWGNADKLIVWNGSYLQYGLYQPADGEPYWMLDGAGWAIPSLAAPSDVLLSRGEGVWFLTGTDGVSTNAYVSGDVFMDDSFNVDLVGTLTLLSYPYTSEINLTNLVVSNATASATWANADKVIAWNGSYVQYGLYQPASGAPYWMLDGAGWAIPSLAAPSSVALDLGKGFWYLSVHGAKTVGFSRIYTVE